MQNIIIEKYEEVTQEKMQESTAEAIWGFGHLHLNKLHAWIKAS